jgi:hypothetical protein
MPGDYGIYGQATYSQYRGDIGLTAVGVLLSEIPNNIINEITAQDIRDSVWTMYNWIASSGTNIILTTTGSTGVATFSGGILNIPNYTFVGVTQSGIKYTISPTDNITVGPDYEYLVYGDFTIEPGATFSIQPEGKLVIINGALTNNGALINLGSVELIELAPDLGTSSVIISGGSGWGLTGNSGTVDGINFLGTLDNIPLTFIVNGTQSGRIDQILYSTFFGYQSGVNNFYDISDAYGFSGHKNTGFGYNALVGSTSSCGHDNTAVGFESLQSNVGIRNTAVGSGTLTLNTGSFGEASFYSIPAGGGDNTALGYQCLANNIYGWQNTAIGSFALWSNTTGGTSSKSLDTPSNGFDNTAVGFQALYSNTFGNSNVAVGSGAMYFNTTSNFNTAVGFQSLYFNISGLSNTSIGYQALYNSTVDNLTAVGFQALHNNTIGTNNTAIGYQSLCSNIGGSDNTAIGYNSLYSSGGSSNTSIGSFALYNNSSPGGPNESSDNTAIGHYALFSNIVGSGNIAIGTSASSNIIDGGGNISIGYSSLFNNNGNNNVSIGSNSMNSATFSYGLVAIGAYSLNSNISGINNTAVGYFALASIEGDDNTALGYQSLFNYQIGDDNTAIGSNAMGSPIKATHSGSFNTAVGSNALLGVISGDNNTGIGYQALYNSTASNNNTAVGYQSLYNTQWTDSHLGGDRNTAVGYQSMISNYRGVNNIAIGYGSDVGFPGLSNSTVIGFSASVYVENTVVIGNGNITDIFIGNDWRFAVGSTTSNINFTGALQPYYSGTYSAGTLGQVLISQGSGNSPQWGTMSGGSFGPTSSYSATASFVSGVTQSFTHSLGTNAIVVQTWDESTWQIIDLVVIQTGGSTNSVDIISSVGITSSLVVIIS